MAMAQVTFGGLLKRLRLTAGLTQEALAERAGLSAKAVSGLERQPNRTPRLETITLLADALGLDQADRARLLAAARPETAGPPAIAEGDQVEFPAVHGAPSPTASMVESFPELQVTPLLGRSQELELIRQLLVEGTARLVTLIGPAGVGKTRLALEVANRFGDAFPDGSWFVDLAPLRDPLAVPSTIAERLGLADAGSDRPLEQLGTYLEGRDALVILDNVEQVLSAAPLFDTLLAAAPGLRLLVTSREVLHLRTEQSLPVLPLALPDPEHLPPLDQLVGVPSVALFAQRAQMINPSFRLSDENARAVAELVVHLDGLPLAIELAAARTQLLSPQMLLERLRQRLSLLRWEAQDLPERQAFFRNLGVFVGGFTLDGAEAVAEQVTHQGSELLERLASLVDQSLVQREEDQAGGYRFRLLESMREFALEQGTSHDEGEALGQAHARYFLALAERAGPELAGPGQREWLLRLEQEHENLRAALRRFWDHGEDEPAIRMVAALGYFWLMRGYLREGAQALEKTVSRVPARDARLRATLLNLLGLLLTFQGAVERARAVLEEALTLGRALGDTAITAQALTYLGCYAETVGLSEEEKREARQFLEEALALHRQVGDRRGAAFAQIYLGIAAYVQQRYEQAEQLWQEVLAIQREIGAERDATFTLLLLGVVAGEQGQTTRAVRLLREGLDAIGRLQDRRPLMQASHLLLWWLGGEQGDPEQRATLLGAAEASSEAMGPLLHRTMQARTPKAAVALQARLGTERFEVAYRAGRRLSFSQIRDLIARVLTEVEAESENAEGGPGGERRQQSLLSQREEEVLRLVAEGLTNKEIARRLILSENTVKAHVTSLFNKLGVDSRAQAVAVAAQQGLLNKVTGTAAPGG